MSSLNRKELRFKIVHHERYLSRFLGRIVKKVWERRKDKLTLKKMNLSKSHLERKKSRK